MKDCCYSNSCTNYDYDCDNCEDYEFLDYRKDPSSCLFMSQECEFCYFVNYCYQTKKIIYDP